MVGAFRGGAPRLARALQLQLLALHPQRIGKRPRHGQERHRQHRRGLRGERAVPHDQPGREQRERRCRDEHEHPQMPGQAARRHSECRLACKADARYRKNYDLRNAQLVF
jgi:hypothetical protein